MKAIRGFFIFTFRQVVITTVYIPPCNTRFSIAELLEDLNNYLLDFNDDYNVCGDFNAHTGTSSDTGQISPCVLDDDDSITKKIAEICESMSQLGIPIERCSRDTSRINDYGKKLLKICKANLVCMFNGRVWEDSMVGRETTTFNTVVDYVIGSSFLLGKVHAFNVMEFDPLFSDVHCGISFVIENKMKFVEKCVDGGGDQIKNLRREHSQSVLKPRRYDKLKVNEYIQRINLEFVTQVIVNADFKSLSEINEELKKIFIEPTLKVFPKKGKPFIKKNNNCSIPGYDQQCYLSRIECHKAKYKKNIEKSLSSRYDMITKSKKYKNELKRIKVKEKSNFTTKLRNAKAKDLKLFWQILQGTQKKSEIPILITEFMNHFWKLAEDFVTNFHTHIDDDSVLNKRSRWRRLISAY